MKTNASVHVASELRGEIARQQLRQRDLAPILGLAQSSVSARLNGRTPLSINEVVLITQWLRIPFAAVMPGGKL